MTRGLKIKITLVTISTIVFCLVEKYVLKHELNLDTVITVLVCILPITIIAKFPEKK
jgi:ABC-type iron transport system FetAB permease component